MKIIWLQWPYFSNDRKKRSTFFYKGSLGLFKTKGQISCLKVEKLSIYILKLKFKEILEDKEDEKNEKV